MKSNKIKKVVFVIFLILMIVSFFLYHNLDNNDFLNGLRDTLKEFGILAPIVFILIYIIGTIFIPSTPFMILAGIFFGFKYGLFYTLIGGMLSSIIVFFIARVLGKEWVDKFLKNKYLKNLDKYNKRLADGGIIDLIILRIIPIFPFNILNVLMGISKMKPENYILGSLIGLIPSNVLAVYFGTFLIRIF